MRIIVLLFLLFVGVAEAKTVFVDNNRGNDTNTGASPAEAVATLRKAMSLLKTSDKLVIANTKTPYFESLIFSRKGGTPSKPMIIEGGGAIISGLREITTKEWTPKGDGIYFAHYERHGALAPYLVMDNRMVPRKPLVKLTLKTHYWAKEGVYFKVEPGKSMADYKIFGTILSSGVAIRNSSYILCRGLIAEYFSNDGFNIHGNCRGLVFRNIESRKNGDDGFSIHEDVGASVYGGHFHQNDFGVQDVNASWSIYHGLLVENNRKVGIHFAGGWHSVVDSVVRGNTLQQLKVSGGTAKHIGLSKENPMVAGTAFLKNIVTLGGDAGLQVYDGSAVSATNCVFASSKNGVIAGGECHLTACVICDSEGNALVVSSKDVAFHHVLVWPCEIKWMKKIYKADNVAELLKSGVPIENLIIEKPVFSKNGKFRLISPCLPPEIKKKLHLDLGLTRY
ncbi:MAG: right-handed parallel beta-helix repeat-containing protein [Victivallales bacterium]|nr:right-handed parallel beta-helix repeat-containing protein [Victivallales bacterium]